MRTLGLLATLLLTGCMSQNKFLDRFFIAECDFILACTEPAVLVFNGYDSADACVAARQPDWESGWASCADFERKAARECLEQLDSPTCPAEGEEVSAPAICEAVYTTCTEPDIQTPDNEDDSGA